MKRTGFALVAMLVALALVGAGCGGDDDSEDAATVTETTETDTTTDETTTDETTEAGGSLSGTVGPGFDISLETGGGTVAPGSYELTVEDLSSAHNFHLTGPGVDVMTSVSEEGTETFTVNLEAGTYEFVCDPHASQMNGSFEVG